MCIRDSIITEDDRALARGLERALDKEGRDITLCAGLDEARTALEMGNCDLMILDVNLPDGSGFDFLREIREKSDVPVMMLTVNDMEADIVSGLEAGADDYMTKPFSLAVLRARVNTLLRRRRRVRRAVRIDGYSFDFDAMEFFHEGRRVELSKTEPVSYTHLDVYKRQQMGGKGQKERDIRQLQTVQTQYG